MKNYFSLLLRTLNSSIAELDEAVFEKLVIESVRALENGNKIIVAGLGKNVPICDKFVGTMLSFGLNATFLHTNTAVHGDLGTIHKGDLIIILSKSGETSESLYLLNEVRYRDVKIWSITFNEGSTLARNTDETLVLSIDHEGDEWNIVPNNSTTLYLIVLQALAITISKRMGITIGEFRKNHPGGYIGVQLNEKK